MISDTLKQISDLQQQIIAQEENVKKASKDIVQTYAEIGECEGKEAWASSVVKSKEDAERDLKRLRDDAARRREKLAVSHL